LGSFFAFGSNFGGQLWGATVGSSFAAALTNSCFEERQLLAVALESNFGKQLSELTFGGGFSGAQF
jgi:hypothetical protein